MAPPLPPEQFPVARHHLAWNHAGIASIPVVAAEAMATYADDMAHHGSAAFDRWDERAEEVRGTAAALMGVDLADMAFVKNTTEGLSFVATGLDWRPGDRVLVPDREFPSTVYPWLGLEHLGVEVELVEPRGSAWALPTEAFEEALEARGARVVCVSWVQYARGWRLDLPSLAEVCHRHGALLCVDAIQGLGAVPADFGAWGVDLACADAHKWLLGPLGVGVMSISPAARRQIRPSEPGWASVVHRDDYENLSLVYDPSARRYEGGSVDLGAIAAMGASLDLLATAGPAEVWAHVDRLCSSASAMLAERGATILSDREAAPSGIVTFEFPGVDSDGLAAALDERDVLCAARGGGVRISPHAWMPDDEVDRLAAVIDHALTAL
ncbi:MAG: aminotransferase class V-fold PLP-dependent enzyme [Acidimicrobiia bacterium]|nr:aminotransferase class V-fold PLP-dependent enzyme [Acidimicrobiia bacterium]